MEKQDRYIRDHLYSLYLCIQMSRKSPKCSEMALVKTAVTCSTFRETLTFQGKIRSSLRGSTTRFIHRYAVNWPLVRCSTPVLFDSRKGSWISFRFSCLMWLHAALMRSSLPCPSRMGR